MTKTAMRIVLGGVRGSIPLAHPGFTRFGGATTCVLVDNGAGGRIVLDAGSGLRTLQPLLATSSAEQPVLMLFTHYHLDHLIGLPPFGPLYDPAWHVIIAAPPREGVTAEQAIRRLTDKPFWPAPFRAQRRYLVLPETCGGKPFQHGPFDVRWCAVHHANGCHAYRIDERASGASMVFATDLEWGSSSEQERADLLRLCTEPGPVDVLILEGHDDMESPAGWGHSTWQQAVQVAQQVRARRLVITHLAPDDDDATLTARGRRIRAAMPHACLGRQGMSIAWRKG
jgi:phosphoribosyl 1,2-cyclic phosphodiesterase